MKLKVIIPAIALAVSGFAATSASALSVDLDYQGQVKRQNVTTTEGTFSAGGFKMEDLDSGAKFVAWCLDLSSYITDPATYEVKKKSDPTVFSNGGLSGIISSTDKGRIQSLYDVFYADVDTSVEHAAFQSALWTIVSGSVVTSAATDVINQMNSYLSGLGADDTSEDTYTLLFFEAAKGADGKPSSQNLVAGFLGTTPYGGEVPLPGAGLLLFGALGGLGIAARRRKAS